MNIDKGCSIISVIIALCLSASGLILLRVAFCSDDMAVLSPFCINAPKVPDRPAPDSMVLPAGYDRPEDIRSLGARWARYGGVEGLTWDLVEQEPGIYDWSRTDYLFSQATQAGVNLVVIITSYNRLDQPDAVKTAVGVSAKIPRDMAGYLRFLETAVERYDGDGIDDAPNAAVVQYWEVGNEVDFPLFWSDSPENYAQLLKKTYQVIKRANPGARVLIAGMSQQPDPNDSYQYYFSVFKELERIKDNPRDRYFDILSLHVYNLDNALISGLTEYLAPIKAELAQYGHDLPIWITETCDYSGSPRPLEQRNFVSRTEGEQAANLIKIHIYSLAHGVKKIFWLTLTEWAGYAGIGNGVWDNVGLINNHVNDGQSHKKLAYYAYQKMTQKLEGTDWERVSVIQEKDGIFIYRFFKGDRQVWVAWNDAEEKKQVNISGIVSSKVSITEMVPRYTDNISFKSETRGVRGAWVAVALTKNPVIIEEN
ncbi:MAG: glycosyl hydrolase [Candidatus Omnitrophota bacterium]